MIIGENPVLFNDYKQFNDYRKQLNFFDFMKQKTGTLVFRKVSLEALFYAVSKGVRYR